MKRPTAPAFASFAIFLQALVPLYASSLGLPKRFYAVLETALGVFCASRHSSRPTRAVQQALEALSISGCPRVTDRGLMCVVRWTGPLARFNRLRRLCYTGCYRATGNVQRFLLNEL